MNTITKSGTNGIHGDAFYFWRNDTLDARGFFDPSKAELRRHQFGYAVGGPFWKNKLFWFTDYQGSQYGCGDGAHGQPTEGHLHSGGLRGFQRQPTASEQSTLPRGCYVWIKLGGRAHEPTGLHGCQQ